MHCVICHSPHFESKRLNEEIHRNFDIIYVPVRVLVCANCGERYYDRKTMQYLENMRIKLQHQQAQLKEVGRIMATFDETAQ